MVLIAIATTRRHEVDWITRQMGRLFPEGGPASATGSRRRPGRRPGRAYARLLADPDPAVRERAARDWCRWEDTHVAIRPDHRPDPRYDDRRSG